MLCPECAAWLLTPLRIGMSRFRMGVNGNAAVCATGGDVINVLFAAMIGGAALGSAAPNVQYFVKGTAAGARVFHIINRQPGIQSKSGSVAPTKCTGELELQDVSFAYPARPDVSTFSNFNLKVPAGGTVALVGESVSNQLSVMPNTTVVAELQLLSLGAAHLCMQLGEQLLTNCLCSCRAVARAL